MLWSQDHDPGCDLLNNWALDLALIQPEYPSQEFWVEQLLEEAGDGSDLSRVYLYVDWGPDFTGQHFDAARCRTGQAAANLGSLACSTSWAGKQVVPCRRFGGNYLDGGFSSQNRRRVRHPTTWCASRRLSPTTTPYVGARSGRGDGDVRRWD